MLGVRVRADFGEDVISEQTAEKRQGTMAQEGAEGPRLREQHQCRKKDGARQQTDWMAEAGQVDSGRGAMDPKEDSGPLT